MDVHSSVFAGDGFSQTDFDSMTLGRMVVSSM